MTRPTISILTPIHNRAHVLHRAYDSLNRQKRRDFEWVVVDDGSTDHTSSLLARWQAAAEFPITWCRYSKNRGRNAAVNFGAELVSGDYTMILDSDDELLDNALETIAYWRERTQIDSLSAVSGFAFRCVDEAGTLVGRRKRGRRGRRAELPQETLRKSSKEMRYRAKITFEFLGAIKTPIFREHKFTELTHSEHCPESTTHNQISNRYETIFVDHPVRRYFRNDGEARLSDTPSRTIKWPRGYYLQALFILNDDIDYFWNNPKCFLNAARKVTRLGLHIGRSPRLQLRDLCHARARLLWAVGVPGGLLGYARDRLRGRRAPIADPDISAWGPAAPPENPEFHPPPRRFGRTMPIDASGPEIP